jgi:hypothetical protein
MEKEQKKKSKGLGQTEFKDKTIMKNNDNKVCMGKHQKKKEKEKKS